jgi:hypothetical protein
MRRHHKLAFRLIVAVAPCGSFASPAHAACTPSQVGTANCPDYTAPATTAVPGPSMDGSTVIAAGGISVTLFNGVVPPNGFMVQINNTSSVGNVCNINDNGPASTQSTGFLIGGIWVATPLPNIFITPPGYKPMGPVSIMCSGSIHIEARGW